MKRALTFLVALMLCIGIAFAFMACASDKADGGNNSGVDADGGTGGDDAGENGDDAGDGTVIAVEEVAFDKETLTVQMGQGGTLTPILTPVNANETLIWETSDPEIATVENGNITCVGVGSCTIKVSTQDKSKWAACSVKVLGVEMTEEEWTAAINATIAALQVNGSYRYYNNTWSEDPMVWYMFDGEMIYFVAEGERNGTYYAQEDGKIYKYTSLSQLENSSWKKELYTEMTFEELVEDLATSVRLKFLEDYNDTISSYDPETDIYSGVGGDFWFKDGKVSKIEQLDGKIEIYYENFGTSKVELPEKAQNIAVSE